MKRLITLVFGFSAVLAFAHAEPTPWSVSVVQGSHQLPAPGEGHFKKEPFKMVFKGPSNYGYAVLASASCEALNKLRSPEEISQAIRPTNILAESPETNKNEYLVVNEIGLIEAEKNGAHLWTEDPSDNLHSFQTVKRGAATTLTATRNIVKLIQSNDENNAKQIPISAYTHGEICMLITGLPPVGRMVHENPKLMRLIFD